MKSYLFPKNKYWIQSTITLQIFALTTQAFAMDAVQRGGIRVRVRATQETRSEKFEKIKEVTFEEYFKFQLRRQNALHPLAVIEVANQAASKSRKEFNEPIDYLNEMNQLDASLKLRKQVALGNANQSFFESPEAQATRTFVSGLGQVLATLPAAPTWSAGMAIAAGTYLELDQGIYNTFFSPVDRQMAQIKEFGDVQSFEDRADATLKQMKQLMIEDQSYATAMRTFLNGYGIRFDLSTEELLDPVKNPDFAQAQGIAEIRALVKNYGTQTLGQDLMIEVKEKLVEDTKETLRQVVQENLSQMKCQAEEQQLTAQNKQQTKNVKQAKAETPEDSACKSRKELKVVLDANEHRMAGIHASAMILKALVGQEGARTVSQISGIATASLQISSSIHKFALNLTDSAKSSAFDKVLTGAILSGDLLSVGMNLVGLFFGAQEDPVMAEMRAVREDLGQIKGMIQELATSVQQIGEHLDKKLNQVLQYQEVRFDHIDNQLSQVLKNQKTMAEKMAGLLFDLGRDQKKEFQKLYELFELLHKSQDRLRSQSSVALSILLANHQELSNLMLKSEVKACFESNQLFANTRTIDEKQFINCHAMISSWMESRAGADSLEDIAAASDETLYELMLHASEARKSDILVAHAMSYLKMPHFEISRPAQWVVGVELMSELFLRNKPLWTGMNPSGLFPTAQNPSQGVFGKVSRQIYQFREFYENMKSKNYLGFLMANYKSALVELRSSLHKDIQNKIAEDEKALPHWEVQYTREAAQLLLHPYSKSKILKKAPVLVRNAEDAQREATLKSAEAIQYLLAGLDYEPVKVELEKLVDFAKARVRGFKNKHLIEKISVYRTLIEEALKYLYPKSVSQNGLLANAVLGNNRILNGDDILNILDIKKASNLADTDYDHKLDLRVLLAADSENEYNSFYYPVRALQVAIEVEKMNEEGRFELSSGFEKAVERIDAIQTVVDVTLATFN